MRECHLCEVGKVAHKKGSVSCSTCGAGKFGEIGPVCTECHEGRYRDGDAASALSCEACPAGFYQATKGQASCLPCVPGKHQDKVGQPSCDVCTFGLFANETNMTECRPCEIGRVADDQGSASCSLCLAGRFGEAGPNRSLCTPCHKGRYRERETPDTCSNCPTGFTSKAGGSDCDKCQIGEFGGKDGKCRICQSGLYNDLRGQSACSKCKDGLEPNKNRTACAKPPYTTRFDCEADLEYLNNSDSDRNEWECERCMPGAYCERCPGGDCNTTLLYYPTLDGLRPKDGWWTVPKEYGLKPHEYYIECAYSKDCRWEERHNSSCVNGTRGVGCSVCTVGWDRIGRQCEECYEGEVGVRVGSFFGVILVVLLLVWMARKPLRRLQRERPALWRDAMLLVKILVSFTQ